MEIVIDYRERASGLIDLLSDAGIVVNVGTDYMVHPYNLFPIC